MQEKLLNKEAMTLKKSCKEYVGGFGGWTEKDNI